MDPFNVLSLFTGIAGIDLGLERAGMRIVGQVERDPFCRAVLAHHYPKVPQHDDVNTAATWWLSQPRPVVHMVAGGFPCQPVSLAGLGLAQDDPRWQWPGMVAAIDALRPEWVLWENVPGLRTRGLDIVHADLVRLGYTHRVGRIRACEVGAPHARPRLLGVAHAPRHRRGTGRTRGPARQTPHRNHLPPQGLANRTAAAGPRTGDWASEPRLDRLVDGLPRQLVEQHLRAYGNAAIPAVIEHLARLIHHTHHARTEQGAIPTRRYEMGA